MDKKTRWINFLGGIDLIFTLTSLILFGIVLLVFNQLDFIFQPIFVIISSILMPMVIALLLYYLFVPVIDFLEKHGVKRLWGVILLFLVLVGVLAGLIGIAIPALQDQVVSLIESFPSFVESISNTVMGWIENIPASDSVDQLIQTAEEWAGQLPQNIAQFLSNGVSGLSSVLSGLTNVVVTLVTVPIVLFFLLKDADRFFNGLLGIAPPKWRTGFIRIASEINSQVGSYITGQLIIASSIGIMMYIGFLVIGLDYSGILAVVAGFTSIIPYIGPTLAFIPALVIALIDSWFMVVKLILVWLVVQFIDGNLIEPNVMGRQLNVHPLTIIIVLLVMGDLIGVFGLIFGVPIYAILKVLVVYWFQQFKTHYNKYYGDVAGEYTVHSIEEAVHSEGEEEDIEEYKEKAEEEQEAEQSEEDKEDN